MDAIILDSKPFRLAGLPFQGTGEPVLYGTDSALQESSVLTGGINRINLQDGLTMTGGSKPGGSYPIAFGEYRLPERTDGCVTQRAMANGAPAAYIRIAPAAGGTQPAETTNPSGASTGFTGVAANSPPAPGPSSGRWSRASPRAPTFSPSATCTRGQIVTFLYRAMK